MCSRLVHNHVAQQLIKLLDYSWFLIILPLLGTCLLITRRCLFENKWLSQWQAIAQSFPIGHIDTPLILTNHPPSTESYLSKNQFLRLPSAIHHFMNDISGVWMYQVVNPSGVEYYGTTRLMPYLLMLWLCVAMSSATLMLNMQYWFNLVNLQCPAVGYRSPSRSSIKGCDQRFNSLATEMFEGNKGNIKDIFAFSVDSRRWDEHNSWLICLWTPRMRVCSVVNTMAGDVVPTEGVTHYKLS